VTRRHRSGTAHARRRKTYGKDIIAAEITEAGKLGLPIWPICFSYPETAVQGTTCRKGLQASTKAAEPAWQAVPPPGCNSQTSGWQYNAGLTG
jgi:hypothetical protein